MENLARIAFAGTCQDSLFGGKDVCAVRFHRTPQLGKGVVEFDIWSEAARGFYPPRPQTSKGVMRSSLFELGSLAVDNAPGHMRNRPIVKGLIRNSLVLLGNIDTDLASAGVMMNKVKTSKGLLFDSLRDQGNIATDASSGYMINKPKTSKGTVS